MTTRTETLKIVGMHCAGCEDVIAESLGALSGVHRVIASYRDASADIAYDDELVDIQRIRECLAGKGYGVQAVTSRRAKLFKSVAAFLLLAIVVGGITVWGKSLMPAVMQEINPRMTHAMLLGIGFLTGFHCIGMCGGFVVAYTDVSQSKLRQLLAHTLYAFGKTLSYTVLGAGFGLLGASIAITPQIRGGVALAASLFLLIYGLKMLNIFAFLRRFTLRLPTSVNRELAGELRKRRRPLRSGLLTGLLLGCGPLQAMYVMAAGSGDPVQGGMMLLMFGLGTLLPLMGFGIFASLLSQGVMRQMVRVSGILVIAMGAMMAQRGLMMLKSGHMPMPPPQAPHTMH